MDIDDLKYPIGKFELRISINPGDRQILLSQLEKAPGELRAAVTGLTWSQLDTPYRAGGWTVRQVVHHLADAQMNWYVRAKLALTEDRPMIKPYDEGLWAELWDARAAPVEPSLALLEGLNQRCLEMLRSLSEEQWKRRMIHPERGEFTLEDYLELTTWHFRHHNAHISELRKRKEWT
jgi:hypothetical protein